MMEKKKSGKIMEVSEEMLNLIEEIREGYEKALGIKISMKQASYILANKIKKADLIFSFP